MRLIGLFIVCFLHTTFYAQSNDIAIDKIKQSYLIENEQTNTSLFVLKEADSSLAVKLDAEQRTTDSLRIPNPEKKFRNLLAHTFKDDVAQLFWAPNNKKELLVQTIDLKNKTTKEEILPFTFKSQVRLTEFSYNNDYYIMSVKREQNILFFHQFKNDGTYHSTEVSLEGEKFHVASPQTFPFYRFILNNSENFSTPPLTFEFINPKQVTSLTVSASYRKAYIQDDQLILTIDNNPNLTYLLTFNLDNFSYERSSISKPMMVYTDRTKSNSFLFDHYLYQIKVNDTSLCLSVKDLNNNEIKQWKTTDGEEISYALGDVKQINPGSNNPRTLEKTRQFIRKFQNLNGGLSVYNYKNNKLLSIGAVSMEPPKTSYATYFGLMGAIADIALSKPSLNNLDAYANRKVMFFNTVLNNEWEPTTIDLQDLALDQINDFINEHQKDISQINLSIKNNVYYLGYYSKKEKVYQWKPFVD